MSCWDLLEGAQGLLATVRDGATVAFRDGTSLEDPRLDAELEPAGASLALGGSGSLAGELTACRAAGTAFSAAGEARFDAPALRWSAESEQPGTTRSIAILLEDGDLVAVRAQGPAGTAHGDEQLSGAFTRGRRGQIDVAEVLLSTEYGADGTQRRATLELWPADADDQAPCRGAGTVICAAAHQDDGIERTVAFFSWSVEGRAGLGRYEIARRA